ncbi:MAG: HEAT repeat domain-containing protein [Candidatus Hodarchaeales archaeon]|jgi:HEAT repeat protein
MDSEESNQSSNTVEDIDDEQELVGEERVQMLLQSLKAHQIMVRATATESLTVMGVSDQDLVVPLLLKAVEGDTDWWTVRFGAIDAIQGMAEEGVKVSDNFVQKIIPYLKDEDIEFRAKVATALGYVGNPLATNPLIESMNEKQDETREMVASALGRIGDKKAIDVLLKHLTDSSHYVQTAAAEALGRVCKGDTKFNELNQLFLNLKEPTEGVYRSSSIALGNIGNPNAVIPLIKAFKNSAATPEGREDILNSLKSFPEESILEEIIKAADGDENKLLDLIEEAIFQFPFETLLRDSDERKKRLIGKYERSFQRMKGEIDTINAFCSDTFKNLGLISNKEELKTIIESIPRKRKTLARVDLAKLETYSWVKKELYLPLKNAFEWYKMGQGALDELEKALELRIKSVEGVEV